MKRRGFLQLLGLAPAIGYLFKRGQPPVPIPDKIQGLEITGVWLDEAETMPATRVSYTDEPMTATEVLRRRELFGKSPGSLSQEAVEAFSREIQRTLKDAGVMRRRT